MQIYNGQRWTCDNFYFMRVRGGSPLPSDRHHRSNGDCLEGKRENYQSVLCNIVCNNCAQCNAHTYEQTYQFSGLRFVSVGHFAVLRFICVCVLLCVHCMHVYCVVLSHGEVDLVGLKPILRTTTSFCALAQLVGSFDP